MLAYAYVAVRKGSRTLGYSLPDSCDLREFWGRDSDELFASLNEDLAKLGISVSLSTNPLDDPSDMRADDDRRGDFGYYLTKYENDLSPRSFALLEKNFGERWRFTEQTVILCKGFELASWETYELFTTPSKIDTASLDRFIDDLEESIKRVCHLRAPEDEFARIFEDYVWYEIVREPRAKPFSALEPELEPFMTPDLRRQLLRLRNQF